MNQNFDKNKHFVLDLDSIWNYLGYSQKDKCKKILEKEFIINIDYKYLEKSNEKKLGRGGHNVKKIVININTFKLLSLKSGKFNVYYQKIEEALFDSN